MKKFHFIIIIVLGLAACSKDIVPIEEGACTPLPCDTSQLMGKLDTLWSSTIPESTFGIGSSSINFHNDRVILTGSTNVNGFVTSFNALDGKVIWHWKEIMVSNFSSSNLNNGLNQLIVQNRRDMGIINLDDGSTFKAVHLEEEESPANSFGHLLGQYYYITLRTSDDNLAKLIRTSQDDFNNWETVYTLNRGTDTGNSRPNIQSYNLWINPDSGDSILIFQHRMAFPNRVDVLAYNLNTKEIEWKHENLTKDGNSNHQQIFLHDNKAYFGGSLTFYCFDMFNGDILWEHDDPKNTTTFMILKTEYSESVNAIIVKDGQGLYAFDPNTGKVKWYNAFAGDSSVGSGSPTYYDGMIYYTADALLYAVRASSGTVLWSERSSGHPFGATTFRGDVAIDPERRVLYATNNNTLFAIKLFKP